MKILYTGAKTFEGTQLLSEQSLGGFISSSEVPNDFLNNCFDTISQYTLKQNKSELRAFALHNELSVTITNVKAYINYPDSADSTVGDSNQTFFRLAHTSAKADSCGDLYIETVQSYGKPYNVTLVECDGVDHQITLPDIPANGYLILYVQRSLDPITQTPLTNDELVDILDGVVVLDKQESAELKIDYLP